MEINSNTPLENDDECEFFSHDEKIDTIYSRKFVAEGAAAKWYCDYVMIARKGVSIILDSKVGKFKR